MQQLFAVKDYLIEHINFLDEDNCDIDSLNVFDSASFSNNPYCVVISHLFSDESGQSGSVVNNLFDWRVLVNFFRLLEGSRDENGLQIQDAYIKAREIIASITEDPMLDNTVMDAKIHSVLTPMTYSRNDRDEYIMIGVVVSIKEALNG